MVNLPPELYTLIISKIYDQSSGKLAPYATISRQMQYAIEAETFQDITLRSKDLDLFEEIFDDKRLYRRETVKKIKLTVSLPRFSETAEDRLEGEKDQRENNRAFSAVIHRLFRVLASWETGTQGRDLEGARPVALSLRAYCPSDPPYRQNVYRYSRFGSYRHRHSYLRLLAQEQLPIVRRVKTLAAPHSASFYQRKIEGGALAAMLRKLPGVHKVHYDIRNDERFHLALGRRMRFDFAMGLQGVHGDNLKEFSMEFYADKIKNHDWIAPSYLHPSSGTLDHLSISLRKLSQAPKMERFKITGKIPASSQLFWPCQEESDAGAEEPFWPSLTGFCVAFGSVDSFGRWFYERGEGDDNVRSSDGPYSDDEDQLWRGNDGEESDTGEVPDTRDISDCLYNSDTYCDRYDTQRVERKTGCDVQRENRTRLAQEPICDLLYAAGRAVARMPMLHNMKIYILHDVFLLAKYWGPGAVICSSIDSKNLFDVDEEKGTWQIHTLNGGELPWGVENRIRELLEKELGSRVIIEVAMP